MDGNHESDAPKLWVYEAISSAGGRGFDAATSTKGARVSHTLDGLFHAKGIDLRDERL